MRPNAQFAAAPDPDAPAGPTHACQPDWEDAWPGEEARDAAQVPAGRERPPDDALLPPSCLPALAAFGRAAPLGTLGRWWGHRRGRAAGSDSE
eukprot:15465978-Alexandrium_andersonii.AAC.1